MEGRLGREDPFLAILKQSLNRQNFQFIAYLGLLNGSRSDNCREIMFAELKQTVEGNPATVDSFLTLAHASHAMTDKQSSMETYFEKAAEIASNNIDPSSKLRRVMQSQLKVNDLGGAYRTWRRVVPGDRSYIGREFLEALIKANHYSGVMQYIQQLPSKDCKSSATFSAICLAYNGTGDDMHSWR